MGEMVASGSDMIQMEALVSHSYEISSGEESMSETVSEWEGDADSKDVVSVTVLRHGEH